MLIDELGGVGTVSNSAIIRKEVYRALNICQTASDTRGGTGTEYAKPLRDFLLRAADLVDPFCYPEERKDFKPVKVK